jgi:glycosyltransferase involved in cell wall biosynthesis
MINIGASGAEICVIGRTLFETGIGSVGYGTAELLARNFPVSFLPTGDEGRALKEVRLPNGRLLPVCGRPERIKASVFCDVLWNGSDDRNWQLAPEGSLRYAWLVFDSDRLPKRWVELLNDQFDLVIAASPHLLETARRNGVRRPVTHMPIPLDIDAVLARKLPPHSPHKITFGSIAAFHPRKGVETLVEAFLSRFARNEDVRLVLHSNLAIGATMARLRTLVAQSGAKNVRITHGPLSEGTKNDLIGSFDVFVSCSRGEGYSIGPREAMAAGKVIVASAVGGHLDLAGPPGVFLVEPDLLLPARYPEIDNGIFGEQHAVNAEPVAAALERALGFVLADPEAHTAQERRNRAREWSFSSLAGSMGALIDPSIGRYRSSSRVPAISPAPDFAAEVERRLGRRADGIGGTRRQVCAAYDAGFFSIFNSFMSHLVWQEREDRCHAVLPDWDVDRLDRRLGGKAKSFCYGQPGDGNLWLKLFQPLFGATEAEMQDEAWLWRHAQAPFFRHNEDREPLLTFIDAAELYRSPEFAAWRRQYHRVLAHHVRLRPELAHEIEQFAGANLTAPVLIAAHVRHPSHTIEQPAGRIAGTEAYISQVRDEVHKRGADPNGPDWAVFVATDQDRVLRRFRAEFGERAVFYPDVRRTRADEDAAFDALTPAEQNREGHQLQHLVAADRSTWSWRMAWEVARDAYTMARCQCLLHVVSNVSTAVAYMNPRIDMVFCSA